MKPFSIIIPTLKRTSFLLNTLKDLVKQDYKPGFEILVIDQSSKRDEIIENFVKQYDYIKYHFITHFRGLPEARNYGASKAKNPCLLFLDDDIKCDKKLLSEHAKTLEQKGVGVCAGGIEEKHQNNTGCKTGYFQKWSATPIAGFHLKTHSRSVDHAKGCNFSVKKEVYLEVNGVDELLTKGAALYEETDFCLRVIKAGYNIFFNYDAHVYHLAAEIGGCRVPEIEKYIFSLARNRSLIIQRHLPWYYRITAHFYLLKLIAAYYKEYRHPKIWKNYKAGKKEGTTMGKFEVRNESTN
jgi:GT2 family glycosyltransferase